MVHLHHQSVISIKTLISFLEPLHNNQSTMTQTIYSYSQLKRQKAKDARATIS